MIYMTGRPLQTSDFVAVFLTVLLSIAKFYWEIFEPLYDIHTLVFSRENGRVDSGCARSLKISRSFLSRTPKVDR